MNRVHWVVYYWYFLLQVLPRHLNSRLRELKIWEMKLALVLMVRLSEYDQILYEDESMVCFLHLQLSYSFRIR